MKRKAFFQIFLISFTVFLLFKFYLKSTETNKNSYKPEPQLIQKTNSANSESSLQHSPQNKSQNLSRTPAGLKYNEDLFKKKFGSQWKFVFNSENRIHRIVGGTYPSQSRDEKDILNFAQTLSPFLGVPSHQLNNQNIEISTSALSTGYKIDQWIDEFPVYQGNLAVFSKNNDGSIFMINNNLREISHYSQDILVSKEEAKEFLNAYFKERHLIKLNFKKGPVLFSHNDGTGELSWIFFVQLQNPFHSMELVVSAQNKKILHQENLSVR